MSATPHITVLLKEAVEALAIKPAGIYVDGTFGRGGHSRAVLAQLGPEGRLIAFDRDPVAIAIVAAMTTLIALPLVPPGIPVLLAAATTALWWFWRKRRTA